MNFEQEKRRKHIKYALASCELEGCIISDSSRELSEKYIKGEISIKQFGDTIRQNMNQHL